MLVEFHHITQHNITEDRTLRRCNCIFMISLVWRARLTDYVNQKIQSEWAGEGCFCAYGMAVALFPGVNYCTLFVIMFTWRTLRLIAVVVACIDFVSSRSTVFDELYKIYLFHFSLIQEHAQGSHISLLTPLYPEGIRFESWLGHRLSWQGFVVLLRSFRQMPWLVPQLGCAHFWILSISSIIVLPFDAS
jgi:hypothetical protein